MTLLNLFRDETDIATYSPGEPIFRQGEKGDHMFVILKGEVDILVEDTLMETVGAGEIIGEMALIEDLPRSATASARTECEVVVIDKRRFNFLVQQTPHFAMRVMKTMADRLRRMNARFPTRGYRGLQH